jgi:HTH-type transcriptional regulator/antitoxin HipB
LLSQPVIGILGKQSKSCKSEKQFKCCMTQFHIRTADQLPALLRAFRKEASLTQSDVALRLGVTQQTYSALERNADTVGAARLLKLLSILGVDITLSKPPATPAAPQGPAQTPDTGQPRW